MVFDAHDQAFAFFGGACARGIYDNMSTAVDAILIGRERRFNRRFERMCSHHLVEPTACSPAAGWEKGQVESQVKTSRQQFFTPRLRVADYDELNVVLRERVLAWAASTRHPVFRERTILEVFEEEERSALVTAQGPFRGFHEVTAAVSKTCLVSFDRNRYSVSATAVGRPVQIRAYASKIVILQDGHVVGEHAVRHRARTGGASMAHLRSRPDDLRPLPASRAPSATAHRSRPWRCPRRCRRSRRASRARRVATGRW